MRVVWSDSARRDLRAQVSYLRDQNPVAARRVNSTIRAATAGLSKYPNRGRPGRLAGTRELVIVGLPYIVVYAVGETQLTILRVLHTAQDWPK